MKSIDIGTNTIICVSDTGTTLQRDAFLSLDSMNTSKGTLKKMGVSYIELNNKLYVIGTEANELAAIFNNSELRRPLKDGMLNPNEQDALPILATIIKSLLGEPNVKDEVCVYSVPAPPIDVEHEIDYHSDVLNTIITNLGYKAQALNEAVAVANVGLADKQLTGIAVSIGAGLTNIAIMYKGISVLTFSISKSGDWIDQMASKESGLTVAKIRSIKEKGNYSISSSAIEVRTREQNIIRTYYEAYIRYLLKYIEVQFTKNTDMPNFPAPVDIAIAGGGGLVNGFIDVFKEQFTQKNFPIEISDIKLVTEPLSAIARGLFVEADLGE